MGDFERVLKKLIMDADYRKTVNDDWGSLKRDYGDLTGDELLLLMQVWNATARDERVVDRFMQCHCCCGEIA
jgi:hypothetical protein